MNIFVTGHLGYIGVHLVELLKAAGHRVTGCDLGLFEGCEWEPFVRPDVELLKDVGDVTEGDLEGHDALCHLAAISNDPMGDLNPEITLSVNRDKSVELARRAKSAGVGRFLFSGSCSVYGAGEKLDLEETDPLNPLTAYAQSKIETEERLWELSDDGFSTASLRNATAYGHSPMLRIDLVVNNLLGSALSYGEIRIKSDGSPWRPLVHCRDIARAFVAFAEAPREAIHNQAINVGGNQENYQVRDVGDLVKQLIPTAEVAYTGEVGEDPRNYRVKFDKLGKLLPGFKLQYTLASGMEELHRAMVDHGFNKIDFEGDRFVRLRTLRDRMEMLSPASAV
ncbi:UDP-glucose 4-epimerase [Pseudobythopirellula maris]|uniref:UDP-glucose 4-epimerase n=1 Tax=Pseudobythopirellula maris TaxID=2527991 RepID=A0A5C5ZK53_9BACT|nr:NAD(P)-dependent oxidoreductase [Pseudobythopirellula maris]TWT87505.1 UDP-glucose 4-epimerase [Pseudobythopirellula maris]